jgi:hypothetical protein
MEDSGRRTRLSRISCHGNVSGAAAVILAQGLLLSCDVGDRADLFHVEVVDGIHRSVAADRPEGGSALELLWEAPPPDEVLDGASWANPSALAADDAGVAVLDPQLHRVHLFRPDGTRGGSFGRRGQGPGELSNPVDVALHGDTVMVRDPRRPALQLFSRSGDYLGGFAAVDGFSFAFHPLGAAGVVRSSVVPGPGRQAEQTLWLIGFDDRRTQVQLPGDHPLQPGVSDGGVGCWRRAGAGSYLVEVDCTFPLVRVLSAEGRLLREHRIDRLPQQSSPAEIETMVAMIRAGLAEMRSDPAFLQSMVDQALERNRWARVMEGVAGSPSGHRVVLWEQRSIDLGGGDATLHLLDGDGRYLVRYELGASIQAVTVTDARIYLLASDPQSDLRTLRTYRLP